MKASLSRKAFDYFVGMINSLSATYQNINSNEIKIRLSLLSCKVVKRNEKILDFYIFWNMRNLFMDEIKTFF